MLILLEALGATSATTSNMLSDILEIIYSNVSGYSTDANKKAKVVSRVNASARRLYEQADLVNSLDEEVLNVSVETNLVALPSYMDKVRMVRRANNGRKINVLDIPERYHTSGQSDSDICNFKMCKPRALERNIENAGRLTFSCPLPDSIVVTVTGRNNNSSQISETFTITSEYETTNVFTEVFSITKAASSVYDITVTDLEDNTLAIIPNTALTSLYQVLQIFEPIVNITAGMDMYAVEILYKLRFVPMVEDTDTFLCGDLYDQAIAWEYIYNQSVIDKDIEGVKRANVMVNRILNNIATDNEKGLKRSFDKAPNKYLEVHSRVSNNHYSSYPH